MNYKDKQKKYIQDIEKAIKDNQFSGTTVLMEADYKNDDKKCLTSVFFLPEKIAEKIENLIIRPLRKIEPDFYYFDSKNFHITIKNIRTVAKPPSFTDEDIEKVNSMLNDLLPTFFSFKFQIEDIIMLPTSLSVISYSGKELGYLVSAINKGLIEIKVPDNKKYHSNKVFFGNTTLCRFTHEPSKKFLQKAKELRNIKIGKIKIDKINLVTGNAVLSPKTREVISVYELKK